MASLKARRSSPYDDDPMVRLTGLSLDPDFPPHHHAVPPSSSPIPHAPADEQDHVQKRVRDAEEAGPTSPGAEEDFDQERDRYREEDTRPSQDDQEPYLTLRALVSTREAGVIIGKGGKNVAEVREVTGVKAGVSKVVHGVHERILTVSGPLESVAKAYYLVAKHLLENPIENTRQREPAHPDYTTIRLLVAHQLMGSIIGKGGSRIRDIQEESGARIVVSKEMLPQSTERVIEIYGLVDSIQIAVYQISECILNDIERATGTILYSPENRSGRSRGPGRYVDDELSPRSDRRGGRRGSIGEGPGPAARRTHARGDSQGNGVQLISNGSAGGDQRTQTLGIPADMVGCIIGKGGSFINQIRRSSGAKLRIDELQDGQTSRMVTITGTDAATKKALGMIYNQLEAEKQRRLGLENGDDEDHQDYE
ncbi:hypothetical protein SpCBS45565_g03404 [Spizellomyces sp. 'palustris']|nr:hypothetical protein SpCBS45565_g03404 [Spizellomyces sp. 'palustris']